MFGHQNDQDDQENDSQAMEHGVNAIVSTDTAPPQPILSFTPPASDDQSSSTIPTTAPPVDDLQDSSAPSARDDITAAAASLDTNGLLDIKQQALTQLSPLVGHLEQSPEEKFRTTMMMIQASDNQALVKDAYEAAQQITDEKTRAQALLDVINEINYFTQHNKV